MSTKSIPLDQIKVRGRLRPVDGDYVEVLAASITTSGLNTPISVAEDRRSGTFVLVAGAHRLEACKKLGHKSIAAVVLKDKTKDALRLVEIDENLIRHELNPLDRASFLAERKEVYERLHPETRAGHAGAAAKHSSSSELLANDIVSFAKNAAEKTGLDKRTIERSVSFFNRLSPEVRKLLAGSALARNQSELINLSKLPPDEQAKVASYLLSGEAEVNKVAQAVSLLGGHTPKPDHNSGEAKVRRAFDAWSRLSKREQDRLLSLIGLERLLEHVNSQTQTLAPNLRVAD